jgi:hypothetical protein
MVEEGRAVRDILLGLLLLAVVAGAYTLYRRSQSAVSAETTPVTAATPAAGADGKRASAPTSAKSRDREGSIGSAASQGGFGVARSRGRNKGAIDGTRTNRNAVKQTANPRSGEGATVAAAEAAGVPSLYEEQTGRSAEPAELISGSDTNTAAVSSQTAATAPEKKKVLYGVPVQAWLLSRRNALSVPAVGDRPPPGLRVFLQCWEMKKHGPKSLDERECGELAVKGPSADRGSIPGFGLKSVR